MPEAQSWPRTVFFGLLRWKREELSPSLTGPKPELPKLVYRCLRHASWEPKCVVFAGFDFEPNTRWVPNYLWEDSTKQ